jgi:hypothetical protein
VDEEMSERKYVTAADLEQRLGLPAGVIPEGFAEVIHGYEIEMDRRVAALLSPQPLYSVPMTREQWATISREEYEARAQAGAWPCAVPPPPSVKVPS